MAAADLETLVARALAGRRIVRVERIGADLGVFSLVHRVHLAGGAAPTTVVVKRPDPGPNGAAAAAAGAYRREALAYRTVLPATPVSAPRCLLVDDDGDQASFVLEDLTGLGSVDQLDGLAPDQAVAVVDQLIALHRRWESSPALAGLGVRRATPAVFDPVALRRGLDVVIERWAGTAGETTPAALARLLDRRAELVESFAAAGPPTLCHGDPRADNVSFDAGPRAVLFDWQQLAVNTAQADLAWLTATSLEPDVRRRIERDLVRRHADGLGQDRDDALTRYRLGMVLPGLAVLLLAQRQLSSPRAEQMVATSLRRIARAIDDLDVPALADR